MPLSGGITGWKLMGSCVTYTKNSPPISLRSVPLTVMMKQQIIDPPSIHLRHDPWFIYAGVCIQFEKREREGGAILPALGQNYSKTPFHSNDRYSRPSRLPRLPPRSVRE